jgi:hypothetical protein
VPDRQGGQCATIDAFRQQAGDQDEGLSSIIGRG